MLENENIRLRAVEPEDLEMLYRWENDTALWGAGNTHFPLSRFALKRYISQAQGDIYQTQWQRLIICEKASGAAAGTVDLFDFDFHNSRVSLGLFVEQQFRGKHFARQALQLVEDYVFNYLKINQLNAFIAVNNEVSATLFRQRKYFETALLKAWVRQGNNFVDVIVFQNVRQHS